MKPPEILKAYEAGTLDRATALRELIAAGAPPTEAEEALGQADGETDLVDVD